MSFDCSILTNPQQGIVLALFLAGLLGSFTHCVGMCSPFVLSQVSSLSSNNSIELQRIKGFLLLPYHSGRITTYILLGVIASLLSAQIMAYPVFKTISVMLLVLAGIVFLMAAISHLNIIPFPSLSCGIPRFLSNWVKPLFATPTGVRGYLLGMVLGFMPCGLVFAAVMAVTATANPLTAAIAMMAFGLGTMPSLLGISLGSSVFLRNRKHWLQPFSTAMMFANSFILFLIAGGWKI